MDGPLPAAWRAFFCLPIVASQHKPRPGLDFRFFNSGTIKEIS
jgi:hypothetical protein